MNQHNPLVGDSLSRMNQPLVGGFKRKQEPKLDLPRGNLFRRMLTAKAIALVKKVKIDDVVSERWPNDHELEIMIKAASNPAMTSVVGWAKELAQTLVADTIEALGASSAGAEVLTSSLVLSWDGAGAIGVPGFVASAANGGFVAEGDPIPVRQFADGSQTLSPHKLASIAVLTREMIESSNAEVIIGDTLVRSAGLALDAVFFGNAAASAAAPAGIRNGIVTLAASANADAFAAFFEDMATLLNGVGQVGGKGPFFIVSSIGRLASASGRYGSLKAEGTDAMIIPVASTAVGADIVVIAPKAVACAISPTPDMETATTGALLMDSVPTGTFGSTGPERSLFQTDSIALKMRWPVSWVLRNPAGVAWLTPAWK
jgi:hypothetical protein